MSEFTKQDEVTQMCVRLAWALWRGMDSQYKMRYARVIWSQFEGWLEGVARTTGSLPVFINRICSRMGVESLGSGDQLVEVDEILNSGKDREILRAFREETKRIVVRVRVQNDSRKAEFERKMAEREEEEAELGKLPEGAEIEEGLLFHQMKREE